MDEAEPGIEARRAAAVDDCCAAVLRAIRGERAGGFTDAVDAIGVDGLVELAASEHGTPWADVPRQLVPADHRLAILHAIARIYRFQGDGAHLDGDLYQSLVAALATDDLEWAEHAARAWHQLVLHTGESPTIWPQAQALLHRFPDQVASSPGLLGAVATLAATCGAEEAGPLWERVLAHPALGDRAERRWELELDWARCWLLLGGNEPTRAMTVIQRARRGMGDRASARAMLVWTNATLELVSGLTWLGRGREALQVVEDSLRHVEPGSELETWIAIVAGYPAAAVGDDVALRAATRACERATTDTSSVRLRTLVPGHMLVAARTGDLPALHDAVRDALAIESGRPMDDEVRIAWRVHALESALVLDDRDLAARVLADLDEALAGAPADLPVHRLRRDHAALQLEAGDAEACSDIELRAARLGLALPRLAPRGTTAVGTPAPAAQPLRVRLFGPFVVTCGGVPIDDQVWGGRRQARVLLALLLLHHGRVDTDTVTSTLWGDLDPRTAKARISPLCNSLRAVLAAAGDAVPARSLVVRGGSILLELHERDGSDLDDLRTVVRRVRRSPIRSRDLALDVLRASLDRPIADLGTDHAAEAVRSLLAEEARQAVPLLASAWDGVVPPRSAVATVRRVFEVDPTNTEACARLMRLLRDAGDRPAASAVFHATRTALAEELGMTPPAELVDLHAQIIRQGEALAPPPAAAG